MEPVEAVALVTNLDRAALGYWVVTSFVLFVKMFANSGVQAFVRMSNRAFVRPDDAAFFGRGAAPLERELPLSDRAQQCWRNDLENIPIFLFLTLGLVLLGGSAYWVGVYCTLFVIGRVLHTIFYLNPRQPHRNLAFQLGVFATVAAGIHALVIL